MKTTPPFPNWARIQYGWIPAVTCPQEGEGRQDDRIVTAINKLSESGSFAKCAGGKVHESLGMKPA